MLPQSLFLPALTLVGQPITPLEIVAFFTGAACVWLAVRLHIANWPVGLVSVASYSILFWHAKLYADAVLQGAFFIAGIYGWLRWRTGVEASGFQVSRAGRRDWLIVGGAALAGTLAVSLYLRHLTDSPLPLLDAAILCISLAALWWQAQKVLENWWLWILVDVISIPVYWMRDLGLTSLLYVIFLVMCFFGLREWRARLAPVPVAA